MVGVAKGLTGFGPFIGVGLGASGTGGECTEKSGILGGAAGGGTRAAGGGEGTLASAASWSSSTAHCSGDRGRDREA